MPTFTFTSPDGKNYSVNGPDGATAEQAFAVLQKQIGGSAPAATPAPDKYAAAGQQEFDQMKAAGIPVQAGYARRVLQGATMGGADEVMAALSTPLEMWNHGTVNPVEGYNYAKGFEDAVMNDARQRQGALGTAAEIAGSLGSAGAIGKAGFTLAKDGAGLVSRALRLGVEGAGYGGVSGFLDGGNSLDDRLAGATKGAAIGGLVGGAVPVVSSVVGNVAAPVISNVRARLNPAGVATSQVARAIDESGRPIQDIVGDVQSAAAEGQPMYTVADATGFPGQRLLRTAVSANGPGRTNAVEFLEQRQAGQGRRIANTLVQGFQAPQTADQTAAAMTAARDTAANAEYGAVRSDAGRVNVAPVLNHIDPVIGTQPGQVLTQPNDSIESVLNGFRQRLARVNPDDFSAVQRIRGDMKDAANSALQSGKGNQARLIGGALRQLDAEMENASSGFRQANQNFAARSQAIDAIDLGRTAALRGRVEDTIPAFRAMPAAQQQAFRVGYADPLIEQVQGSAVGANKARPFTSDAFQTEAQAIAPLSTGNQMVRQLAREQRMFETRAEATGGSKTDMNLADQASQKVDPGLLADVATLNVAGLGRRALATATNALHGYTPAVREEIAKLLLARGANPGTQTAIAGQMAKLARNRAIAAALMRGATVGTATYLPRTR